VKKTALKKKPTARITPHARNFNIDLLRIIATGMIVTAHVTTLIYQRPDFFGSMFWWLNHIVLSVCRLGAPLFFMISGYLLSEKIRTEKENIRHTIQRLVIPLVSFYILSSVVFAYIHSEKPFTNLLADLFIGGGNYLYFLVGLSIIYFLHPFLQKFTSQLNKKENDVLVFFLLANTALYTLGSYLHSTNGEVKNFTFIYWFLALGYFLYGSFVKKYGVWPGTKKWQLFLFVVPLMINILGSYFAESFSHSEPESKIFLVSSYLQNYLGTTVMLASIGFFNFFLNFSKPQNLPQFSIKLAAHFAEMSFGIYLVHMILLEFFLYRTPLTVDNGPFNPAIMIACIWVALLFSSYLVSRFFNDTSFFRPLVGKKIASF
jgi:surface polysaccharide O-acyltransferase-like enzyme